MKSTPSAANPRSWVRWFCRRLWEKSWPLPGMCGRCWMWITSATWFTASRSRARSPLYFGQCPGDLHTKILEKMRQVLREKKQYPYLMKHAVARLEQARCTALHSGVAETPLIHLGATWVLVALGWNVYLPGHGAISENQVCRPSWPTEFDSARPYFMQFTMKVDEDTFFRTLFEEIQSLWTPELLVYPKELPLFDKYDEYLPESLVRKGFAWGCWMWTAAGEDPELGGCTDLQSSLIAYLQIHFHNRCNDVTFFHLRGYIDGREYLRALPERLAKGVVSWTYGYLWTGCGAGQRGTVEKIGLTGPLGRRLTDLGLVEGTRVACRMTAPREIPWPLSCGEPVIALRASDARRILCRLEG